MGILVGGNVIEGSGQGHPILNAGAPVNGTTEVQTLTQGATGGSFKLTFMGFTTAAIAWNATAAVVDAALELLPTIGAGGVVCAGGPLNTTPVTVTFAGDLVKKNVSQMTVDNTLSTGGVMVVTTSTPGVDATYPTAPIGAQLVDITNGIAYMNTGTPPNPTWGKVGAQV